MRADWPRGRGGGEPCAAACVGPCADQRVAQARTLLKINSRYLASRFPRPASPSPSRRACPDAEGEDRERGEGEAALRARVRGGRRGQGAARRRWRPRSSLFRCCVRRETRLPPASPGQVSGLLQSGYPPALPSVLGSWLPARRGLSRGEGRTPGHSLYSQRGLGSCALGTEAASLRGSRAAGRRVVLAGTCSKEALWWEKASVRREGDGAGPVMQATCWCNGPAGHVPGVRGGPRIGSRRKLWRVGGGPLRREARKPGITLSILDSFPTPEFL